MAEQTKFVDTELIVASDVVTAGGRQKCLYGGFVIPVKIQRGACVHKGDLLSVRLQINLRYDKKLCGFKNASYAIEKLYKRVPAQEYGELFK